MLWSHSSAGWQGPRRPANPEDPLEFQNGDCLAVDVAADKGGVLPPWQSHLVGSLQKQTDVRGPI